MIEAGKRVLEWLFGPPEGAQLRLLDSAPNLDGIWVEIPLACRGGQRQRPALRLAPMPPPRVVEVVEYAAQRRLPLDGWLVTGLDALPMHLRRRVRWVSSLARAARRGTVVVSTAGLSNGEIRRLRAEIRALRRAGPAGVGRHAG